MLEKHFIHNKEVDSVLLSGKYEKQNIMFSIVIPTYKRPTLLEYTLTSAIRQNIIENYEIIVVDNEPYEDKINDTQKVIRKFSCDKLLYFRNKENIGLCSNWNRCIELARGHYVTILHDDDWLDQIICQLLIIKYLARRPFCLSLAYGIFETIKLDLK